MALSDKSGFTPASIIANWMQCEAIDSTLRFIGNMLGTASALKLSTLGFDVIGFAKRNGVELVDATQLSTATTALNAAIAAALRPVEADLSSFNAAATITLEPLSSVQTTIPVAVAAGTVAYTGKLVLSVTGAVKGNVVFIPFTTPAAADRILEIRNASGAGTLLGKFNSTDIGSVAGVGCYAARFNGTAWAPLNLWNFAPTPA